MIEIQDNSTKKSRTITLNEIPVGQVFRGNVAGAKGDNWTRGIFYKAYGDWAGHYGPGGDVLVVRFDKTYNDGYANIWTKCNTVQDYEPLKALVTFEPMA